jgi:WhiB family redox-sensing transcriptional regulator
VILSDKEPWRDAAACKGMDPDLFYPERGQNADSVQARRVCAGCPVRAECGTWAIENGEHDGVWGGMTPAGRMIEKRHRGIVRPSRTPARCGTDAGYYRHLRRTMTEPCEACRKAHCEATIIRRNNADDAG